MPRFFFKALASDGAEISGDVTAPGDLQALEQISRRGLIPVSLTASDSQAHLRWWQRDIRLPGSPATLSPADEERIVTMLASLLGARLSLLRALAFCHDQTLHKRPRRAVASVRDAVENGATLAAAMSASDPGFSKDLVRLVESGEASNRLARVLGQAVGAMSARARLRKELSTALIYPGLLLILATVVLLVLALYLAPTLMPVFSASGVPAPLAIRGLAGFGEAVRTGWPLLVTAGLGLCLALWLFSDGISAFFGRLALKAPGIGGLVKRRETLRITQALGLMLESGAPLLKAVTAARDAIASPPFLAALTGAEQAILAGRPLAPAMAAAAVFDPMAMTLIAAGEESDQLAATLVAVNTLLESQVSQGIAQIVRLVTPVLTLVIGVGVGAVILSTISAIMDMNDLAF